ncbi:hypothetical protein BurJ1DRAFT_3423 [Burkholderiales bacterium JOSHI_001]|nr:hypothetical protein BurJ1DRAFT_3423 [Burkholderiales bacterium JOSHI_001]
MSDASVLFLPWVRQGLAARVTNPDPLKTPLPAPAPLGVTLGVNGVDAAPVNVRLFGPADVIGIDPRQVVRTEPPAGTNDYEANDLAAIEFDNPDLPWLFTPAGADAQGRLRPWLVLVVVRQQDGVRLRPPRTEPLPVLEIGAPALPADELPDLNEAWAWAHAQVAWQQGASADELKQVLATRPELSVARLLSPRLLQPNTAYIACVVPAFEAGRLVGLGGAPDANAPLAPAWKLSGANPPGTVSLPVYYHWEFRTGAREDFESIVARLQPRDLSAGVGRRAMDINAPGFALPAGPAGSPAPAPLPPVLLEGALQPLGAARAPFPDGATQAWQAQLKSILNAAGADAQAPGAEPVLGPPIYGRVHAARHLVGQGPAPQWLDDVNLDPRERVAAALGTGVVQSQQEALMAEAWDQAGELAQVNQRLRQMQLSLAITGRLHARHVQRLEDDNALWRFASPAQARLVMSRPAQGAALTMQGLLAASSTPTVITSAPMRRLARPGGAVSRRAATAMRLAGTATIASAASATAVSSMFRLYSAQPVAMLFVLPPTRGMVSFDAVTRRLPAAQQTITFAQGNNATVAGLAPRPGFQVLGEPVPLIGTFSTTVLATAATLSVAGTTRAAPAPDGAGAEPGSRAARLPISPIDPIDPVDPVDLPPRPPRPPLPPRVDSADAAAFRAAAARHLAVVNPAQPWFFPITKKMVLLQAADARPQVRALLDPAPAMVARMQATVRLAQGGAPAAVGPVGCTPVFRQPMSEALAALSQDWLLPGLHTVPIDCVALLQPNQRFIEAFMLGLNVEMGRELLWRDFIVDDPRATFFRHFWRSVQPRADGDIAAIADWGTRRLGKNPAPLAAAGQVVLLVRSALFRRYPNAVVYAVPGERVGIGRRPGPIGQELQPLFRGSLQPDVSFFGFDLDASAATGNPGWYFVIQQQPTEPRFGFDVDVQFGTATHVPLAKPPVGHTLPPGTRWAFNAAHMAQITRQQPVRVAIHASELIPPPAAPSPAPP